MKDVFDSIAGSAANPGVPDISLNQLHVWQILSPAGREIVQHPHPGTPGEQRVHQMRSDEPGAAGHEHGRSHEIRDQAFTTLSFRPRYTPRVSTISGAWRATRS